MTDTDSNGPAATAMVLDAATALNWIDAFIATLEDERAALGELDRLSGDGDFGTNLKTSLGSARSALERTANGSVGAPFAALSGAFLNTGGTSGPLYGMWFRELARAGEGRATLDLKLLAEAVAAGLVTVQRLGKAQVGDKTMVDAMQPAADALARAAERGVDVAEALAVAATAARAGAQSTVEMVARRGRASYVGEVSRGVIDPGAVTVAILFEAAGKAFRSRGAAGGAGSGAR